MEVSKRAQMAVFLTVFIDLLGFGIVIPILPLYAKSLAAHPSAWMTRVNEALHFQAPEAFWAGAVFVSFSLMQFVATPLLGRISDLYGRRPVLFLSLMGTAVGYLMLAVSHRLEWVLAARMLAGIMGGNISVAQAAMADLTPKSQRSKALGMIGAAFGLGFVLGPALAGVLGGSTTGQHLLASKGWHLPFFVAAGLSLLAATLVIAWLPETLKPEARVRAWGEDRQGRGHALVEALKRPGMPQILGIAFLAMSGFSMMEGTYSLLANVRFGLGQREVGYLFAFIGILIVIYQGGLVRVVAKRIPERTALWMGLALMAGFLPFLSFASWMWPFTLLMIPLAFGSGMNNTATSALASQVTPAEEQGGLFGVIGAVQGLGRIVGPAVGNIVFAKWGHAAAYWTAAGTVGLGLLLALALPRTRVED